MQRILETSRRLLEHRHLCIALGLLSAILLAPALLGGFQLDDHFQRFRLLGLGDHALQLFVFYDGDAAKNHAEMEAGTLPWWTSPSLRHANLRYLSVLSMQLDYLLWPNSPVLMHLHSLVWLALVVWIAAALYRRLFVRSGDAVWAAGLAALLYALDDAHSLPTAYLANRNALLCTFFGLASLLLHMRWREQGWRWGAVLSPFSLALALLAGELGVSSIAFIGAYALLLDDGPLRHRAWSLLPCAAVTLGWLTVHRLGGFGSQDSGFYLDPFRDPVGFGTLLIDRAGALMLGQWTPLPSDWSSLIQLGTGEATALRAVAIVTVCALLLLLAPVLRQSTLCRFFLLGSILALAPISAVGPQNRLLFFVGFGAMGTIGCLGAAGPVHWRRVGLTVLLLVHAVLAPAMAYVFLDLQTSAARAMERASNSVPDEAHLAQRDLILINPSDSVYLTTSIFMMRWNDGRDAPRRIRVLAHGSTEIVVSRVDESSLRLELAEGLFPDPFSRYHRSQTLDFEPGDVVDLGDFRAEVESVLPNGDPNVVRFDLSRPLESKEFLWLVWNGSEYDAWQPPAVGESMTLSAQPGIFG